MIYLDIETTGIPCPASGLVQLAGEIEIDGKTVEKFCYRVKPFPGDVISDEALTVNGITRDELAKFEEPGVVFARFIELLGRHVDRYNKADKAHFVGYNARFDADHLRAWFDKNNDKFFGSWFWHPVIDVMGLAAVHFMGRRAAFPDFKLTTVAAAAGIHVEHNKAHDASYDVLLTKALFKWLAKEMALPDIR